VEETHAFPVNIKMKREKNQKSVDERIQTRTGKPHTISSHVQ